MPLRRTVRSPSTGLTRSTFAHKQWVLILQDDDDDLAQMLIFRTQAEAQRIGESVTQAFAPIIHYVELGEFV